MSRPLLFTITITVNKIFLLTFEKKKWALISITDRSTYGEECIRHSSRNFVSYASIAASLKDFTDGRVYLHDGIQISYNRERHIPECRFAGETDGIKDFGRRSRRACTACMIS